jgi:hypoxanthine phosphoribosyltransferase
LFDLAKEKNMKQPKVLISAEQIQDRIAELGRELSLKFKKSNSEPVAVCVLNGSFMFFSDLIRAMEQELTCEFLGVSSYKDQTVSSGEVKVTLDLAAPIEGKDVLIIEDIVDSGLTMNYLVRATAARNPKSITTVAFLYKPDALKTKCQLDHYGFKIGNEFVVGYGLDAAGLYRNLPYLGLVEN